MKGHEEGTAAHHHQVSTSATQRRSAAQVAPLCFVDLQRTAGNAAVNMMILSHNGGSAGGLGTEPASYAHELQVQRFPHIDRQRLGRLTRYGLGNSWRVGWAYIHARVAGISDLARFTDAFGINDLTRGSVVSHSITLPDGSTARIDLSSRRSSGREGETRLVAPRHVNTIFHRGADLSVALGLSLGAPITDAAVQAANARPDQLQRALDDQVFEVLVHELSHALILLERGLPAGASHSNTFNDFQSMLAASVGGATQRAAENVDLELYGLIRDVVRANVSPSQEAQVLARVRADPDLVPARVREWFIDERVAWNASGHAAGTTMDNAELAGSYVERLRLLIRAKVGRVARIARPRSGGSEALSWAVRRWLDATTTSLRSQQGLPLRSPSRR